MEVKGPLFLYIDHEKKELAFSLGIASHLFSPIEAVLRGPKELHRIRKEFESRGYQITGVHLMKNSTQPKDGEATILINTTAIPSH